MSPFSYTLGWLIPISAAVGAVVGGVWSSATFLLVFLVLPCLDAMFGPRRDRAGAAGAAAASVVLWVTGVLYLVALGAFLWRCVHGWASWPEAIAAATGLGIAGATSAANVAHELGHRRDRLSRVTARCLLALTLYVQFDLFHAAHHHRWVATPLDADTARLGESWYRFIPRAWAAELRAAWHVQSIASGGGAWRNALLHWLAFQGVWLLAVASWVSVEAGALLLLSGVFAHLVILTANYIEHYGIRRLRLDDGTYEPVTPAHSWNSDHVASRAMLLELPRHPDHHAHGRRPYHEMDRYDESPQLPFGYPAMFWIALVPPLWRSVTHPELARAVAGRAPA